MSLISTNTLDFHLQWSEHFPPNKECSYDHMYAESPLGKFQFEWKSWKDYDSCVIDLAGEWIGTEDTVEEAKAFCNKHLAEVLMKLLEMCGKTLA